MSEYRRNEIMENDLCHCGVTLAIQAGASCDPGTHRDKKVCMFSSCRAVVPVGPLWSAVIAMAAARWWICKAHSDISMHQRWGHPVTRCMDWGTQSLPLACIVCPHTCRMSLPVLHLINLEESQSTLHMSTLAVTSIILCGHTRLQHGGFVCPLHSVAKLKSLYCILVLPANDVAL